VFSRHKKNSTDQQTDRQQIWFTGTLFLVDCCVLFGGGEVSKHLVI
jgi:hypothetical protein